MSESHEQNPKFRGDNVFQGIPVAGDEANLFALFLDAHDLALNSQKAYPQVMKKFGQWFTTANKEPLCMKRVTIRDMTDFRENLRREQGQAVSTVNRAIVTVRKFFGWLVDRGHIPTNPAKPFKELKQQALAPKGLDRADVRKLLREVELRQDTRSAAIFNFFLADQKAAIREAWLYQKRVPVARPIERFKKMEQGNEAVKTVGSSPTDG